MSQSALAVALLPAVEAAGLLLIVSGGMKLAAPGPAQASVAAAGLPLPAAAARALGAGEAALGLLVMARPGSIGAAAAALAFGCFALFVARLRRAAGRDAGCGCFGADGGDATAFHVWLNAIICAICALAAVAAPPGPSWVLDRPPLQAAAVCLGVAATAYACFVAFTAVPRAWRSYAVEGQS